MKSTNLYAYCAAALLAAAAPQAVLAQTPPPAASEQQQAEKARLEALLQSLHPQTGTIHVPAANVSLNLANDYYFLPADDAKRVLTEGWGNAPDAVGSVLGMVFPARKTFLDPTWGAVIEYQGKGHVSDKDAASQDYNAVLSQMQSATEEANKEAAAKGYRGQHLIGWAQAPTYDSATKTLIWARDIQFDGQNGDTLNYDVRTLGRTGVLSLNMVDSMANLGSVRDAARGLGSRVSFDKGAAYADYNASTDKLADYGLAGLVAAGAGVVVAKKGLLAIILIFAKKAIALVVAGFVAAVAWFKRKFGRGYQEEAYDELPAEQLPPAE